MKAPACVFWFYLLPGLAVAGPAGSGPGQVPNGGFTVGEEAPDGWTLQGGQGRWVDRELLEVTGTGRDSSYWRSVPLRFAPKSLVHFQFRARRVDGAGTAIAGPVFANRDYRDLSGQWNWFGHVLRVPENAAQSYLRLGQWHATGSIQFDAVRLTSVVPVHRAAGEVILGEGEAIRDGRYEFRGSFGYLGSNYHRTLQEATAGFNSDRWVFGPASSLTYRFGVPGYRLLSGQVSFHVNYHTRGGCVAEVSRDGAEWHRLATQSELGTGEAAVGESMFPAPFLLVRLRPAPEDSSFQVNRIAFEGRLDGSPPEMTGKTDFARIEGRAAGLTIDRLAVEDRAGSGQAVLRVTVRNTGTRPTPVRMTATLDGRALSEANVGELPAGGSVQRGVELPVRGPGEHRVAVSLAHGDRPQEAVQATVTLSVPDFYRSDYGELLGDASGSVAVWWCEASHKIPRQRPLPAKTGVAARLAAARGDFEAVQVVVRPRETLRGLTASAADLTGPDGASIGAGQVKILRVYYHFVHHPTDATGVRDWWPDALPPLDDPIDVVAGQNQPLWVLVHVPRAARAGDYSGQVRLRGEGFSATVPLALHVWDFALPERNHLDTAFGFSAGNVFRYHGLKEESHRRRVLDKYLQCFSDHRISPYNPVPLDPIRVEFLPDADPPAAKVDFSAFDPAFARAVEKFHFTGFRLPIQGMGGGTFHARYEPKIGPFTEETPEYQAMFSSYVRQLEEHFRQKGWLDLPYIYWFDEPAPKDYAFVRKGFVRLKRYAPGLRTMLTEEPVDALAGPVDIWCPVTPNYDHEAAEARRAHGEKFWWYVCTGPKAPYATLFIDHPATDLRVWLWQTWKRNIAGILVWQATYWTSSAAFPDQPQNPYEDPMGYVSGYSTPRGVKRYWGNGDGRFVYPPLAAATPGASGPGPVLQAPVSSIRWEMLREGIEDYEFLYLLRQLLAERGDQLPAGQRQQYRALLEVPESITRDMTHFTTDPAPIYARRRAVAEAIEALVHELARPGRTGGLLRLEPSVGRTRSALRRASRLSRGAAPE